MASNTDMKERRWRYWLAALLSIGALVVGVVTVVLALVGTGFFAAETDGTASIARADGASSALSATTSSLAVSPPTTVYVHPVEQPSRIVIPAISVDATIMRVGLKADGDMETPPYGKVGWFYLGPTPGASGSAVIVAHVDTTKKPDVFYQLHELRPGDEIYVWNEGGDSAVFTVDSRETVLKVDLPTERIWEGTDEALIRLITCGGEWSNAIGHYLSNVIVYGHLVR